MPTSTSSELLHSVTAGDEVNRPVVGVSKLDMLMQVTQQTVKQLPDSGLDSGFVNTGRRGKNFNSCLSKFTNLNFEFFLPLLI